MMLRTRMVQNHTHSRKRKLSVTIQPTDYDQAAFRFVLHHSDEMCSINLNDEEAVEIISQKDIATDQ